MLRFRRVDGSSMAPTLRHGQTVVFRTGTIRVGSVVLARRGDRDIIKRVERLDAGRVYLVGDNRTESSDSRHYGPVPKRAILGVIMLTLPAAVSPPKMTRPYGVWLGRTAAGILALMATIHLFRIDTFIPLLAETLETGFQTATAAALVIIVAEIFAIPFALRMRLSPLGHLLSGLLLWIAPLLWLFVSSWSLGYSETTGQLGEFVATPASIVLVLANLTWLLFNHLTLYTLGYNRLRFSALLRK